MRSLQQILAELVASCRRYPSGGDVGLGSSNAPHDITSGSEEQFLNVNLQDFAPAGCDGMATVHVFAGEKLPDVADPAANSKLVITGAWQSGLGGGDFQADGAHGCYLVLGANSSVQLSAKLVSAVEGEPMVIGSTYRMEAVVKWYTSATHSLPFLALPAQPISAINGRSPWFKIPRQARTLRAFAVDVNAYGNVFAELATVPDPAAIRYSEPSFVRSIWVVNGVEWVRFASDVHTTVFPGFELCV